MSSDAEILPDAVVSHYRLVNRLGGGGMGEVWVGIDETLRRRVAMKAIRKDRRLDRFAKARFLREARILSQLDHANICRVYDYIDSDHRDWLILELIEGDTLRAAIGKGMTHGARLRVALAIADVLVAMHAAGVIHRDLKPTNVMLTLRGDAKVLDFGLSAVDSMPESREEREAGGGSSSTIDLGGTQFHSAPGSVAGTLAYMSPEQMSGDSATTASDMYSFGVLLDEMYTAVAPAGASPYPRATPKPPAMPRPIRELIARLTATAPSQRPTAVEALKTLREIADAPRVLRRRLIAAALIAVAIAGAIKYTWDLARERTAAIAARDEADRRRQQAESLIGFMVGDLRTRLTAVGRLDLLDEVGKRSIEYFNAVPGATLTGEELFRRSQTMHQLGQVRQARADMKAALAAYEESLALAQQVVNSDPANAKWQLGLGTSHFYVGDMKRRAGDLDGALGHFRAYQEIAARLVEREPANVEYKLELSYGYSNVAAILSGQRNFEEARRQLELTRDIQGEIERIKPDDRTIQTSRANNFNRLGVVLQRLGQFEEAIGSFRSEQQIYEELSAKDPQNVQFRRRLPVSLQFLAATQRALGRNAEALETFDRQVATARALVDRDPANEEWRRQLAFGLFYRGRLRLAIDDASGALADFRTARGLLQPAADKNPGVTDQQADIAYVNASIAEGLLTQRQVAAAAKSCDATVSTLDSYAAHSADPADIRILSQALTVCGSISQALGDADGARTQWTKAATLMTPLLQDETEFLILETYVRAFALLGRAAEARPFAERLLAIGYRDSDFLAFWNMHAGPMR